MGERQFVESVWYGQDRLSRVLRTALAPLERIFGAAVGARGMLYDTGWLRTHDTAVPAISVGNVTVGGTGKTPVAAWIARELAARGAHPAIVLRGYGADEPRVHSLLNPDIPVVTGADRLQAIAAAAARGADIAVLDDGFQHRRARRVADIVLVSADRWHDDARLLPAGPFREPLEALRRATMIVVTRKAASDAAVDAVHAAIARIARSVPRVGVRLALGQLVRADDPTVVRPLGDLAGASVAAVLAIGDPQAFVRQLEARGARVRPVLFPDHHDFRPADVARIVGSLAVNEWAVCTLKDAVKLAPVWPRLTPPLWYVSQQVMVERGVGGLERLLDDIAQKRSGTSPTAG
ncbi:MAG TPA: tetraacyldisaccharide 4'-kinase [Gemmatimonadaceae bacterium]|nr:tetraacyldisaccharide 4'-kinase [Gemmatimonadaceae bacterium]